MSFSAMFFLVVLGMIMGLATQRFATRILKRDTSGLAPIKVQGHNRVYEGLVSPVILLGTTAMSAIAAWVFAQKQILSILTGTANGGDVAVFTLVAATALIVDIAMVITISRFQMHLLRGEKAMSLITGVMFVLILSTEAGTLMYFFYTIDPGPLVAVAKLITNVHNYLYVQRDVLLPVVIAFLATAVRPLVITADDRRAQQYAQSSQAMAAIQLELTKHDSKLTPDEKRQLLADYITQYRFNINAHPGPQAEIDAEKKRTDELITHLKQEFGFVSDTEINQLVRQDMLTQLMTAHGDQAKDMIAQALADFDQSVDARHTALEQNIMQRVADQLSTATNALDMALKNSLDALRQEVGTAIEQMSVDHLGATGAVSMNYSGASTVRGGARFAPSESTITQRPPAQGVEPWEEPPAQNDAPMPTKQGRGRGRGANTNREGAKS